MPVTHKAPYSFIEPEINPSASKRGRRACLYYTWKDWVEVRPAYRNNVQIGMEVFATRRIKVGAFFPHLGRAIDKNTVEKKWSDERASHAMPFFTDRRWKYLDAKPIPENYPTPEGVAFFGLSITATVNEPVAGAPPNCAFRFNALVTIQPIARGEELTVFYGDEYRRTGPYLTAFQHPSNMWRWIPDFGDWAKPDAKTKNKIQQKWIGILQECIEREEENGTDSEGTEPSSADEETDVHEHIKNYGDAVLAQLGRSGTWPCPTCRMVNRASDPECAICFEGRPASTN
jgi:hypothetical protein